MKGMGDVQKADKSLLSPPAPGTWDPSTRMKDMARPASQPLLSHSLITTLPLSPASLPESWHHRSLEPEGSFELNLDTLENLRINKNGSVWSRMASTWKATPCMMQPCDQGSQSAKFGCRIMFYYRQGNREPEAQIIRLMVLSQGKVLYCSVQTSHHRHKNLKMWALLMSHCSNK